MRALCVGLVIVLAAVRHAGADAAKVVGLDNGTFKLQLRRGRITSLQVDPAGGGRYGPNWMRDMGFEGFAATARTKVTATADAVSLRGLVVEAGEDLQVRGVGVPSELKKGHTLGCLFELPRGRVRKVAVHLPTWATKTSSATLRLRKDGPGGEVLAERRLANVPDNSWHELACESQPAGKYYVELSDPAGKIGWWGSETRTYQHARAYRDGKPMTRSQRSLRIWSARGAGTADVDIRLAGKRLVISSRFTPAGGEQQQAWPLVMNVRWDNTGYDVSAKAVPFSRFFTDTMRYIPTRQIKRWRERDGLFEYSFSGCRWIEADGTGNHDLRFLGRGVGMSWHAHGADTTIRLPLRARPMDKAFVQEIAIEARPRADDLPPGWPAFDMPDPAGARDATTFFHERAFMMAPVWGGAAWHEWNTTVRCWQGGGHLDVLGSMLETYPLSPEGYVHTWGATAGWPFPDVTKYDTRHFDTNARFLLGCRRHAAWTGDRAFLARQAGRLRRAMEYQLTVLKGADGLIVTASKDVNGRHKGIGDNYWDILPFGHLDAYANAVWYASLEAMAQIEEMLAQDKGAPKTDPPGRKPEFYRHLAPKVRAAYNRTFWDDKAGRYIGCVDIDGKKHDYGFTFVNLEAMAYGLADEARAKRIYHWMETEPTSSGQADTYSKWIFAPRATTLHNPPWQPGRGKLADVPQEPWWHFGWRGTAWGDQCQDGGAILYTSYYDLMARTRLVSPENAWKRWGEILDRWRMPDHLCGGPPLCRGERPQHIAPGQVGVDVPFPESSLVPCWLLYGLLGAEATPAGLVVAPRLPKDLPWLAVRNVAYRGLLFDIKATANDVTVRCDAEKYRFVWNKGLDKAGRVVFRDLPEGLSWPDKPIWHRPNPWSAQWIWADRGEAPLACFRKRLSLPAQPAKAVIHLAADNEFELFVNGKPVVRGDNWQRIRTADLTALLRKGENVLAVAARNPAGPGGLLAQLDLVGPDGANRRVATDRTWLVAKRPPEGWHATDFNDSAWQPAKQLGTPPCAPWGELDAPEDPDDLK